MPKEEFQKLEDKEGSTVERIFRAISVEPARVRFDLFCNEKELVSLHFREDSLLSQIKKDWQGLIDDNAIRLFIREFVKDFHNKSFSEIERNSQVEKTIDKAFIRHLVATKGMATMFLKQTLDNWFMTEEQAISNLRAGLHRMSNKEVVPP